MPTLSLAVLLTLAGRAISDAAEFPRMGVETVSGIAMDLPEDFAAGPSVILIVYDQNQQPEADSWLTFLDDVAASDPSARYFVMPVLPAGLSMVRGMVEGIVRNTATDPSQLDRTIILFTDVEALQQAMGLSGTSAVHIAVLDDTGQLAAMASGAYSAVGAEIVRDALAALASESGDVGEPLGGEQAIEGIEYLR